jgi:hypothetical protein
LLDKARRQIQSEDQTVRACNIGINDGSASNASTTSKDPNPVSTYAEKVSDNPIQAQLIPRNSKVYIAPFKAEDSDDSQAQGFESYIAAAFMKRSVPFLIVANPAQADFIIEGNADRKGAGWAKKTILKDFRRSTSAAMTVTNLRPG